MGQGLGDLQHDVIDLLYACGGESDFDALRVAFYPLNPGGPVARASVSRVATLLERRGLVRRVNTSNLPGRHRGGIALTTNAHDELKAVHVRPDIWEVFNRRDPRIKK
jgi:hypothetical protein